MNANEQQSVLSSLFRVHPFFFILLILSILVNSSSTAGRGLGPVTSEFRCATGFESDS